MEQFHIIPVHVITLIEDPNNPVLFLYCQGQNKIIPVMIGKPEARILALSLDKANFQRPMTHHLLQNTIEAMGGVLSRVVIFDVKDDTFYSKICIQVGTDEIQVDARPSDALILAVQSVKPIFVTERVLQKAGKENPIGASAGKPQQLSQKEIDELKRHLAEAQEREQKESQ